MTVQVSQGNVEILRQAVDAYNRRGVDAYLENHLGRVLCRVTGGGELEGTVFRGHAGIRSYVDEIIEDWGSLRIVEPEYLDFGDQIVLLAGVLGCGPAERSRGGPAVLRRRRCATARL